MSFHPLRGPLDLVLLHGGPSTEHDVSVASSREMLEALRRAGHRIRPVWVDRAGLWHFGSPDDPVGTAAATPLPLPGALSALMEERPDCALLGFHGTYGEDGRIQAALDLAGLPFTGSGVTASAAAMDKPLARRVFAGVGLPVAKAIEVQSADLATEGGIEAAVARVVKALGLPAVVKVPAGGSSIGVEIPHDAASLGEALARLGPTSERLLIESFIDGVELTAGVVEDAAGRPEPLPIVEIVPRTARFFDYEAKYDPSATDEIVPARIPAAVAARAQALGVAAHVALGCRGMSRTDLILGRDGGLVILETNTLPGMTPASLLPKAAAAAGLSFTGLLHRILLAALTSARPPRSFA
jgi:D-alanine-D-alanine ligase